MKTDQFEKWMSEIDTLDGEQLGKVVGKLKRFVAGVPGDDWRLAEHLLDRVEHAVGEAITKANEKYGTSWVKHTK